MRHLRRYLDRRVVMELDAGGPRDAVTVVGWLSHVWWDAVELSHVTVHAGDAEQGRPADGVMIIDRARITWTQVPPAGPPVVEGDPGPARVGR